jgi:rod shape-determining protein MreC
MIDSGRLKRENRALRAQVAELSGQQRQAQIDLKIDQALKHLLHLQSSLLGNASPIPARVVISDPGNFESTITLDRGQEAGIEKGMAVEAYDGVVGNVIDSWHGGAEVRVLTDPESAIAVRTVEQPIAGIAQGQAGSHDLVVYFDASARVHRGDAVVTADVANSDYPPDLQVGTVTSVEEQPAGLGLVVEIAPTVDFDALEFVEVLRWVPGEGPVLPTTTISTTTSTTSSTTTTTPSSNSTPTSSSTPSTTTTTTATSISTTTSAPTSGGTG